MKIEQFHIYITEVDLGGKIFNPRIVWTRKQAVFVEIVDAHGTHGWGECWTFDQSAAALLHFIDTEIRPAVIGREVLSIEALWNELWSNTVLSGRHGMAAAALSGLDCALWDIHAKGMGRSVGEALLPGEQCRPVPVYASGGLYVKGGTLDSLQSEMRGHVEKGYQCVKMKIGALDFSQDLARTQAVREAIGPDVSLIVDAVYSLDRDSASKWAPVWKSLDVESVQAPFPARDWDAMSWLNNDCGIPVMVFEAECRYEIFRALLERRAIGTLQFSPIAVGGITPSLALIQLAQKFGCCVSLQCSSTWLAEMIALQLGSSHSSVRHVEMHTLHQMLFEHADPTHRQLQHGCVVLGDTRGLGFSVPKQSLHPFTSSK